MGFLVVCMRLVRRLVRVLGLLSLLVIVLGVVGSFFGVR
jgi:hypothetical protein